MRLAALVLAALLPLTAAAAQQQTASTGTGAVLRGLEEVTGDVTDLTLKSGETVEFGPLTITLKECRYPQGDPAADAYAFLTISDKDKGGPIFSGWMIASSPALNALDHPRYDVWVLRCQTD